MNEIIDVLFAYAQAHPWLTAAAVADLLLLGVVIDLWRRDSETNKTREDD